MARNSKRILRKPESEVTAEIPAEAEAPVTFTPQDLPYTHTTVNISTTFPLEFREKRSSC